MDLKQIITHCVEASSRVEISEKVYENISPREAFIRSGKSNTWVDTRLDRVKRDCLSKPHIVLNKREDTLLEVKERWLTKEFRKQMYCQDLELKRYQRKLNLLEGRLGYCKQPCGDGLPAAASLPSSSQTAERTDSNAWLSTSARSPTNERTRSKSGHVETRQQLKAVSESRNCVEKTYGGTSVSMSARPRANTSPDIRRWETRSSFSRIENGSPGETMTARGVADCVVRVTCPSEEVQPGQTNTADAHKKDKSTLLKFTKLSLGSQPDAGNESSEPNISQASTRLLLNVHEDEETFPGEIRPRSRTIPSSERKTLCLPEIKVEDFSEKQNSVDPANTDQGVFSVFASPPRRRAYTCPDDLFRRRKGTRPPTPPPFVPKNGHSKGRSKFNFPRKKLGQLAEDKAEPGDKLVKIKAPQRIGIDNATTKLALDVKKSSNGYTFSNENSKYIARPSNGISGNSAGRDPHTVLTIRRANTISDGQSIHMYSWSRNVGTELKS